MSPTDPIASFNFPTAFSRHHRSQRQRHKTKFALQSLHFAQTTYQYPIIMVNPSPETKSAQTSIASMTAPGAEQPACWTEEHETELTRHAARGEDAKSIIELLETDYPCLNGQLSEEWIKRKVKAVKVVG